MNRCSRSWSEMLLLLWADDMGVALWSGERNERENAELNFERAIRSYQSVLGSWTAFHKVTTDCSMQPGTASLSVLQFHKRASESLFFFFLGGAKGREASIIYGRRQKSLEGGKKMDRRKVYVVSGGQPLQLHTFTPPPSTWGGKITRQRTRVGGVHKRVSW